MVKSRGAPLDEQIHSFDMVTGFPPIRMPRATPGN